MKGHEIYKFAEALWPLHRSITGEGVRVTLRHIQEHLPGLIMQSVPSGTQAFDWQVPQEWKVHEAYIITPSGDRICDVLVNNLHLVGYSVPYEGTLNLSELKMHLHTLPSQPNAIPYVTSYYSERWGFCMSHETFECLEDGEYFVKVDTELFDGALDFGELILEGESSKEIFISTYICHPSMANNEISGPAVVTFLADWLQNYASRFFTYRIVFVPETIGSIVYLSLNYRDMKANVVAGFNVSCIGDDRAYSYLPSRGGDSLSDHVAKHVLVHTDPAFKTYTWSDRGSDERQYCAPGIDLPVASIMRSKYGEYPEYHTSLDDLHTVVTASGLDGGFRVLRRTLEALEKNRIYRSTVLCEPQMGRRGLYPTLSKKNSTVDSHLMMDLLSLCDGTKTLLEIAENLSVPIWKLYNLVDLLVTHDLLDTSLD